MSTKICHIIIPLKDDKEIDKAKDFFINVLGLSLRGDTGPMTESPNDVWTDEGQRLPDRAVHLMDNSDTFIDLVGYNNRPVSYAKGIGSGKGIAIALRVDSVEETWGKIKDYTKDYTVQPVYEPLPYPEWGLKFMKKTEGHYSFCSLNMGKVSDDGEEQILEIVDWKP